MIGEIIALRDGCEGSADETGILLWKDRFDAGYLSLIFATVGAETMEQTLVKMTARNSHRLSLSSLSSL